MAMSPGACLAEFFLETTMMRTLKRHVPLRRSLPWQPSASRPRRPVSSAVPKRCAQSSQGTAAPPCPTRSACPRLRCAKGAIASPARASKAWLRGLRSGTRGYGRAACLGLGFVGRSCGPPARPRRYSMFSPRGPRSATSMSSTSTSRPRTHQPSPSTSGQASGPRVRAGRSRAHCLSTRTI